MSNNVISENRDVYEITWKKCGTDGQITGDSRLWRMGVKCWINKATGTHSEYVILAAFPRQKWSQGRTSKLRYTFIAYL